MTLIIVVFAFIIISFCLIWFLLKKDRGPKEPPSALWTAAGFGLAGIIAAFFIEKFIIPVHLVNGSSTDLSQVFLATLAVGAIEETCKFLPLAIYIYKRQYFDEHTDGIIYFAIAGLAFGVPENILYSTEFGAKVGLSRLILTPIFHAATTSLVGYFLVKSKIDKKSLLIPTLALFGAMIIHGLYDFGLDSKNVLLITMSLMITAGMTALFFILFMRANEIDRQEGLSAVGHNDFCRSCGHPNPEHFLYCESCGNRA